MIFVVNRILIAVFIIISAIVLSTVSVAQTDEQILEYRQAAMQGMGSNMAAISIIIKSRLAYQENLFVHAQQLKNASTLIESAFANQLLDGPTDALPAIWKNWEDFLTIAKSMGEESERLAQIGPQGDLKTLIIQVKAVSKTCAKCHKKYRKPEQDSYRN